MSKMHTGKIKKPSSSIKICVRERRLADLYYQMEMGNASSAASAILRKE
jgi:hypothetical protein